MSGPLVIRSNRGRVAVLTLNRPEARNALSRALLAALGDALTAIEAESKVRGVVLTGAAPTFCAGMDLREASESNLEPEAEHRCVAGVQAIADVIAQVHRFPKPTVAALNGDALAGGAGLALSCDFVVASEWARIGFPEVKRGLVAAIALQGLVRQIGERRARSLLLTGAPIDAGQAERWGLINRVVPGNLYLDEAVALAESLAAGGPHAIETTKRLLDEASGYPADLRGAAAVTAAVRVSDEADEGMRAFLEKREPRWLIG